MAHDGLLEFNKLVALQGLGHVVGNHLISRAVFNSKVALFNLVREKEITDIQSTSALTRAALSILLQKNSTLVILVQDVLVNLVPLRLHKQFRPEDVHRCIIRSHEFRFSRALRIELLLAGKGLNGAAAKCHHAAGMTLEVRMDSKSDVDVPFNHFEGCRHSKSRLRLASHYNISAVARVCSNQIGWVSSLECTEQQ